MSTNASEESVITAFSRSIDQISLYLLCGRTVIAYCHSRAKIQIFSRLCRVLLLREKIRFVLVGNRELKVKTVRIQRLQAEISSPNFAGHRQPVPIPTHCSHRQDAACLGRSIFDLLWCYYWKWVQVDHEGS
jgi:hypothetical protein